MKESARKNVYEAMRAKLTPAGRIALVVWLLHPTDENGDDLEPIITRDEAIRLLSEAK